MQAAMEVLGVSSRASTGVVEMGAAEEDELAPVPKILTVSVGT